MMKFQLRYLFLEPCFHLSRESVQFFLHFKKYTIILFLLLILTKDLLLYVCLILIPAPFPGGCCLTCNMEFDPNLVISYDRVETNVTFAYANVYYKR